MKFSRPELRREGYEERYSIQSADSVFSFFMSSPLFATHCGMQGASDAPDAARERCGSDLVGAQSALDTNRLASQIATDNNAKKSTKSRQRLSDCYTVRMHQ